GAGEWGAKGGGDGGATDHGDDRFGKRIKCIIRTIDRSVVPVDGFLRRTLLLEFGNVGSRNEGLATGPGHYNDADIFVVLELLEKAFSGLPHFQRNGIVTLRIVEGQIADLAFLARQHLVRLRHQPAPSIHWSWPAFGSGPQPVRA